MKNSRSYVVKLARNFLPAARARQCEVTYAPSQTSLSAFHQSTRSSEKFRKASENLSDSSRRRSFSAGVAAGKLNRGNIGDRGPRCAASAEERGEILAIRLGGTVPKSTGDIATANMLRQSFRFTRDCNRLTAAQRLFYEKNGYLLFPGLIEQQTLDICHKRFDDIVSGRAPADGITVMYDVKDRKSVNKLQNINWDRDFCKYIEHPKILDIVEAFTGPNIMAVHNMLIAKPPDIGFGSSKHPPHQDLYYFPFRPADRIVASWTAMEPCTRENGCLFVSPGTHTLDRIYPHDYPPGAEPGTVNKFYHGILDLPETTNWVHLEMEPGDTVFFHPLLVHGSGVNTSKRTRRAISCHYAAAECEYIDLGKTVQSRIEEELLEYTKRRYPGSNIKYQDLWRLKSTLVRGIRSSL